MNFIIEYIVFSWFHTQDSYFTLLHMLCCVSMTSKLFVSKECYNVFMLVTCYYWEGTCQNPYWRTRNHNHHAHRYERGSKTEEILLSPNQQKHILNYDLRNLAIALTYLYKTTSSLFITKLYRLLSRYIKRLYKTTF